jgi:hypothetical protein
MSYSRETIQAVWGKGTIVGNDDPSVWRQDACGAWIGRRYYGDRTSQYGWEIDHIRPQSDGGQDELSNLRPLQWENNACKQDGRLIRRVTASGARNIRI